MQHHIYADSDQYPVAVLVKNAAFNLSEMQHYISDPLEKNGVNLEDLILVSLPYNDNNKAPVSFIKEQLSTLLDGLTTLGTNIIFCCDANYFKVLTKKTKAEVHLGYVLPCAIDGYKHFNVVLGVNHKTVLYNPNNQSKLTKSINTVADFINDNYVEPGLGITSTGKYIIDPDQIQQALDDLHQYSMLSADIEAGSLRFEKAGIGTITFCWSESAGIAFPVDYRASQELVKHPEIRAMLKKFFETYQGTLIWHNANYDLKVLIYNLWMNNLSDRHGLLEGLEIMTRSFEDTKVILYLATNSTAGNELGLKAAAQEFAGNWAEDVKDITKLSLDKLLKYNYVDGLSTWYVYNKYYDKMVVDNQLNIYENLLKPSIATIIQTELTGMPLCKNRVEQVKRQLKAELKNAANLLANSNAVQKLNRTLQIEAMHKANAKLKVKQHSLSKFADVKFNPNSSHQVAKLLYSELGLPIIERTSTQLPATGGKVLKNLLNHTDDQVTVSILEALIKYAEVEKILSSFIPSFEDAVDKGEEDIYWLHGSFNIGGTVSGRLSSCVAPWTRIKTSRGLIPITELRIGDLVWTHRRRWKPVFNVIQKPASEMVDIHFCNGYILSCTTAHKLNVPNKGWTTVQEIINERIENLDAESYKYSECTETLSGTERNKNSAGNCRCITDNTTQCIACPEESDFTRKIETPQGSPILSFQNRRVESNEKQNWRPTSQLYWRLRRWLRLSNSRTQRQTSICSQNCDGRGSWIGRIAQLFSCASYRRQSTQQYVGQSSTLYTGRTQDDSQFTSDECIGKIKAVYHRSVTPVWDITVADDHSYWAEGCFNHNSDPNLQNIPSNSTYGKLIKYCFVAPKGYLFVGADFNSLEDMVSALQTKDPNKLRVYEDGLDSHCFRAYTYFKEDMPDITNQLELIEQANTVVEVTFEDGTIDYLSIDDERLQCPDLQKQLLRDT